MSTGTEHTGFEPAGVEQRLKAQIDRYPVRLRPELAREAYDAHRRHRLIRRSVTAGTLAVVAAVGIAVATGAVPFSSAAQRPGPVTNQAPSTSPRTVPPASFQPPPAPDSLTRQQAAKEISFMRITTSGTRPTSDDDFSYGYSYSFSDGITYHIPTGASHRGIKYTANGTPADDNSFTIGTVKDGKARDTTTQVNYSSRTWWRFTGGPLTLLSQTPTLCAVAHARWQGLGDEDVLLLMADAGSLLTCKGLVVTRGQRIDGIDAITIAQGNVKIWLNATTDIPIQQVTVSHGTPTEITQFGYLPATPANLAYYLRAAIPPGFTQVRVP